MLAEVAALTRLSEDLQLSLHVVIGLVYHVAETVKDERLIGSEVNNDGMV